MNNNFEKDVSEIYNKNLKLILEDISTKYNLNKEELIENYLSVNINSNSNILSKKKKPLDECELCYAKKQDGERCTRRHKPNSDFCGKHINNQKFGRFENSSENNCIITKREIIQNKTYLVDKNGIVYTDNINSPTIVGTKVKQFNLETKIDEWIVKEISN